MQDLLTFFFYISDMMSLVTYISLAYLGKCFTFLYLNILPREFAISLNRQLYLIFMALFEENISFIITISLNQVKKIV